MGLKHFKIPGAIIASIAGLCAIGVVIFAISAWVHTVDQSMQAVQQSTQDTVKLKVEVQRINEFVARLSQVGVRQTRTEVRPGISAEQLDGRWELKFGHGYSGLVGVRILSKDLAEFQGEISR